MNNLYLVNRFHFNCYNSDTHRVVEMEDLHDYR
jgi:hypothetical protein